MKNAILILIASLLVAGCMGPTTEPTAPAHEGTDGLQIEFISRSPPDEVYVQDIFPLSIEIRNKGAYDITNGKLLFGVEEEYINIPSEYKEDLINFNLNGRTAYDPIGGIVRETVQLSARSLDPQSETHTTIVSVTACYPYKTEATAQVCVDTDIFGQRQEEKICTPTTLSMGTYTEGGQDLPKGQGAPIAITKIEQRMLQHPTNTEAIKPEYTIYVKNMGGGLPVASRYYQNACRATGVPRDALNVVGARVYLSDRSMQLDCKPKLDPNSADKMGHIKLEKDEDFIKCELSEGVAKTAGTFNSPLMIDLDYGYTFTVSKNVLIRKQV